MGDLRLYRHAIVHNNMKLQKPTRRLSFINVGNAVVLTQGQMKELFSILFDDLSEFNFQHTGERLSLPFFRQSALGSVPRGSTSTVALLVLHRLPIGWLKAQLFQCILPPLSVSARERHPLFYHFDFPSDLTVLIRRCRICDGTSAGISSDVVTSPADLRFATIAAVRKLTARPCQDE